MLRNFASKLSRAAMLMVAVIGFAGAGNWVGLTAAEPANVAGQPLQIGDVVKISLEHPEHANKPPYEQRIKDDGSITLPLINSIQAANKTPAQLEKEIRETYLNKKFYKHLSVIVMSAENRFFFVNGKVTSPGRFPHVGDLTVTKAIAAAGGFTPYGNKSNVLITRQQDGTVEEVDCSKAEQNPALDLPVFPGDIINVRPRKF